LWQTTINKVNIVNPAFLMVSGDLVNTKRNMTQVNEFKTYAAQLKPTIPMYTIPGNHDIGDIPTASDYSFWQTNFGYPPGNANPWYSFSYGNTLFICLDSMVLKDSSGYPGKDTEEMNWLTTTLQNSSGYAHKIVFMHISLCLASTTEADQTFNMPLGSGSGIRKQLLDLFHQYGVEAVFSGHYHVPAYVHDGNLEIITTESCTCPLGSLTTDTTGFQIVNIYPNHIEHTYRTLNSIVTTVGDFNDDGAVNFEDMGIFAGHWLENGIWP
jgi:serine/threonine-protein phosphatase CPPED1